MTVITHNRRRSRLSTLIDQPGGISTTTALRQAAERLAELEVHSQAMIEDSVRDLNALPPPSSLEEQPRTLDRVYRLGSAIIDAAGPFARADMCSVAANLCDLVDRAPQEKVFDWRIVTVHAQAFRLLMALPPEEETARQQVLDSLKDVRRIKVGDSPN